MALPRLKSKLQRQMIGIQLVFWVFTALVLLPLLPSTAWGWLLPLMLLLGLLLHRWISALEHEIAALNLHAGHLQEQSFNSRANAQTLKYLSPLALALEDMSAQLRQQRATLYQRELLLDTVLQSSPSALVLTDEQDRVLLTNPAARLLFGSGQKFDGRLFSEVLSLEPELAQALGGLLQRTEQGLIHLGQPAAIWHWSGSQFLLNQRRHYLYLCKPMTAEIQREELNAWKKLLRVIGHELNNSLAPLSSLAYSGQQMAAKQPELQQLLQTIQQRCQHLNQFLQAYITFAKLPPPEPALVNWARLLNQLHDHYEFEWIGELPQRSWLLDQAQLSQLLLNLLKNAHESGSAVAHITLNIRETPQMLQIEVCDQGGGLSAEVFEHALLPFYTTKAQGSGIGLTLCRDITEAHGGQLTLRNEQGGLCVQLSFSVERCGASEQ